MNRRGVVAVLMFGVAAWAVTRRNQGAPDMNLPAYLGGSSDDAPTLVEHWIRPITDGLDEIIKPLGGILSSKPRGIRNNNPGNIEYTGVNWQGLDNPPSDGRFMRFTSPEYGIRAFARVLDVYRDREGLQGMGTPDIDTVAEIINRWAPSHENPTNAYAQYVADAVGVSPEEPINIMDKRPELIAAMIQFENGQQPYPMSVIREGVSMA